MATWPAILPAPLLPAYAVAPLDKTIRSEMEAGAPRVRSRTSARLDQVPARWSMTDAQAGVFRAWFDDASTGLSGGSAWFTGLSLRLGMGSAESRDCRFVGPPKFEMVSGNRWAVSATIEVR